MTASLERDYLALHAALRAARSRALRFQFGILRFVFGSDHVFLVSLAMVLLSRKKCHSPALSGQLSSMRLYNRAVMRLSPSSCASARTR
jgi:hypothetical protein